MPKSFFHFLIALLISFEAFACPFREDPDDYFDSIGAECIDYGSGLNEVTRGDLGSGKLTFSIGTGEDVIRSVTIQSDGKLVAVGKTVSNTLGQFLAVRFDVDGGFDPNFNTTGFVQVTFGTKDSLGHRVLTQTDGKIMVVGRSYAVSNYLDYLAVRYLTDGSLDTSFATKGFVQVAIGTSTDIARSFNIDSLGKYYLVGYSWEAPYYFGSIVRLNTDGTTDTSFATTGKLPLNLFGDAFGLLSSDLDTSGRVLLAGTAFIGNWQIFAGRMLSNGSWDTSFQTIGYVLLSIGTAEDQVYSLKGFGDKVVLAGSFNNGTNMDVLVIRLNSDGTLDTAYGGTGKVARSFSTGDDYAYDIRLDSAGGLVGAGYGTRTDQDFLTFRYCSNGALDTSFVTVGFQFTSLSTGNEQANSIFLATSGQTYPIGRVIKSASDSDVGLTRYSPSGTIAASGSLDDSFGTAGVAYLNQGTATDYSYGLAMATDGRMVIVGGVAAGGNYLYARVNPNGSYDTSFHTDGKAIVPNAGTAPVMSNLVIQSNGAILDFDNVSTGTMYLVRLTSNGVYDTSFSTVGWKNVGTGLTRHGVLDTLGRPVGLDYRSGGSSWANIYRLNSNGSYDTTFATTGLRNFTGPGYSDMHALEIDSQGRFMLGGASTITDPQFARLMSNGAIDTSFQTVGWLNFTVAGGTGQIGGIATGADGKIWGAAAINGGAGVDWVRVYRLESSGILDTSFATIGMADFSVGGDVTSKADSYVYLQSNNKLIFDQNRTGYANYARINSNGTLDTSFNTTGRILQAITNYQGYKFKMSYDGRLCGVGTNLDDFGVVCFWP